MFSKHVWYDRQHQAEIFSTREGVMSGTIVAYEGAVCMINPRPEILLALYQEAKIRRILAVKAVVLTSDSIEFTRGLCAFVNYCRGLRRRSAVTIISRTGNTVSTDFLSSCCSKLWGDSQFDVNFQQLDTNQQFTLGKGTLRFTATSAADDSTALLSIATAKGRVLHYYDELHRDAPDTSHRADDERPNVVIRAATLPNYLADAQRSMVTVPG